MNYDHFVKTFIAHDGDKFTLPLSLLLKHGFYPVNSQTESIPRVKCRELKFLIDINIFRALGRESRGRIRIKDGYVALPLSLYRVNRKKKLEKAKKTDTSKRFNWVILRMCFLGRPHLKK